MKIFVKMNMKLKGCVLCCKEGAICYFSNTNDLCQSSIKNKLVHIHTVPIGFPSRLHSTLELFKVNKSDSQAGKVAHIIVEQLGSIEHAIIKAPVTNLKCKKFILSSAERLRSIFFLHLKASQGWRKKKITLMSAKSFQGCFL